MSSVKQGQERKVSVSKAKSPPPRPVPPKVLVINESKKYDPKQHYGRTAYLGGIAVGDAAQHDFHYQLSAGGQS